MSYLILRKMVAAFKCAVATVLLIVSLGSSLFRVEGEKAPIPCSSPVDVVFLIDSSDLNGTLNYNREKQLIKMVADRLGISPSQSRAAIILYDETARIKAHFDDHSNREYFVRMVNNLPRKFVGEGHPMLVKALGLANEIVFAKARDSVTKVAVVLSCGPQNIEEDSGDLKTVVENLRIAKVRILAVGVGDGANASGLSLITKSEKDVFLTRKFGDLAQTADAIVERACPNNELQLCPFPMDIVFVMDSSGSVGNRGYKKEKYFINRLVQSLRMSPDENRGAVILYSSSASVEVHFHHTNNTGHFQTKVYQLPYYRGHTRTDEGLKVTIKDVLPHLRPDVTKFALVFVNGHSDAKDKDLKDLSDILRGEGVRVLAIGIGNDAEKNGLRSLVASESDIIRAKDLDNLISTKVKYVAKHICIPAPEQCSKTIDIVFVVDASDSIDERTFKKQKMMIKLLAQRLEIAPSHTRVAIIITSTSALVKARFNEYINAADFLRAVKELRLTGGRTRIDEALALAYSDVFNMSRSGVDKIAIVFTDGYQSKVHGSKTLKEASEPLRRSGVRVIAVGIGREVNKLALRTMVRSEEDVMMVESFGDFEVQASQLYGTFCSTMEKPRCNITLDIAFVMDTSGSVGHLEYNKEKDFVKMLAASLGISRGGSRGAIVLYSGTASVKVDFDEHTSLAAFLSAVRKLPYEKGQTRIDKALDLTHREVFSKARPDVLKIAIVLTDGKQTADPDTKNLTVASAPLKRDDIRILAAGVGAADWRVLRLMTKSDQDVFFAEDFSQLKAQAERLADRACGISNIKNCRLGGNDCASKAVCTNLEDYHVCKCIKGYQGDGRTCEDIDECSGENDCASNAVCTNTEGSHVCRCIKGYQGDGRTCQDVDECLSADANECDLNSVCTNTNGSYVCRCVRGYQGDGRICEDVDECKSSESNNCDVNAECLNNNGSYTCECKEGYTGNGVTCDEQRCGDSCHADAVCSKLGELYTCKCKSGYVGDGKSCRDVDECAEFEPVCDRNAACNNIEGSYSCSCNAGYTGDGITCQDVDECDFNNNDCHTNAFCINTNGSYSCSCKAGYTGDGANCTVPDPPRCDVAMDVAFVLDPSRVNDYEKQKTFVKILAKSFNISPSHSRGAFVTYSETTSVKIGFGQHPSVDSFKSAVDKIPHEKGQGRLDDALELAHSEVFVKARYRIPKIAIVLTDGRHTKGPITERLRAASESLKKVGVRTLVVGIGDVDLSQLRLITESDQDILRVKTVSELLLRVGSFAEDACTKAEPPRCDAAMDVAFVMDSSASISDSDYQKKKAFVKTLAKSFDVTSNHSRGAIVVSSDPASIEVEFGQATNTASFLLAVDDLSKDKDQGRIDQAMELAYHEVFQKSILGAPRIAILLVDGRNFQDSDTESLKEAAALLRKGGVRILAVGIGDADFSQLRLVTDSDEDVTLLDNYGELKLKAHKVAKDVCLIAENILPASLLNLTDSYLEIEPEVCEVPVDVVFVMDSSASISDSDYIKEKAFFKYLAQSFDISTGRSRSAVVLSSDPAALKVRFGEYTNPALFASALGDLQHEKGAQRNDKALEVANSELFVKPRPGVGKVIILSTGRRQNQDMDTKDLGKVAKNLRGAGVEILAVGVGDTDRTELRLMAGSDKNTFQAKNFNDLTLIAKEVAQRTCDIPDPQFCQAPVDVAFLLDSSASIGDTNYEKQKEFVKLLSDSFGISLNHSHGAIIINRDPASLKINFKQYVTSAAFKSAIDELPYEKGLRRIDKALQVAYSEVFVNARAGVTKIAIVVTFGWGTPDVDTKDLTEVVMRLKKAGVRIMVVGIGNVDPEKLQIVVESHDSVFLASNFDEVKEKVRNISQEACRVIEQPKVCSGPVDVAFVMDSSDSISDIDYKQEKEVVKLLAKTFRISPNHSRGAVVFSSDSKPFQIGLDEHTNMKDFTSSVDELPYGKGRKRIDKALDTIYDRILVQARAGVPRVAIVLNDGRQCHDAGLSSLEEAATRLVRDGVRVLAVGIGDADPGELHALTRSVDDTFFAKDFEELKLKVPKIAENVCMIPDIDFCERPQDNDCHPNAICTNNNASYTCICRAGYMGNGIMCTDVDECEDNLSNDCNVNAFCTNKDGHYTCECNVGYLGDGVNCTDVDECEESSNCHMHAVCDNTGGSYTCECKEGYTGDGTNCITDVEECTDMETNMCHVNSLCMKKDGYFSCECKAGYQRNGMVCTDVDECEDTLSNDCNVNAFCTNKDGHYTCECNAGYLGDGINCTDVDECEESSNCHMHAVCDNTGGSYTCECKEGYTGDGSNCTDVDECAESSNCHVHAVCDNTGGSYTCECKEGYTGDGSNCTAVEECTDMDAKFCHMNAFCMKKGGDVTCECKAGYQGNGMICTDVDECEDTLLNDCHVNAFCTNKDGHYTCQCNAGYLGDGVNCTDVNECEDSSNCHVHAVCNNTDGSYTCECKEGYTGDGTNCTDVDDCKDSNNCHVHAVCNNTGGSYTCKCKEGYSGDGSNCTTKESPKEDFKADIVFLMDSSSSVGSWDFAVQQEFVKSVARFLNVEPGMSLAGVYSYGKVSHQAVTFHSYETVEEFEAGVDTAQMNGGQGRIDQVLGRAANMIALGGRPGVPKILILLTAGNNSRIPGDFSVKQVSQVLSERLGTRIVVICIGEGSDFAEFASLTNNAEDIFKVPSFSVLVSKAESIATKIASRSVPK